MKGFDFSYRIPPENYLIISSAAYSKKFISLFSFFTSVIIFIIFFHICFHFSIEYFYNPDRIICHEWSDQKCHYVKRAIKFIREN